jgi:hypothetical protein
MKKLLLAPLAFVSFGALAEGNSAAVVTAIGGAATDVAAIGGAVLLVIVAIFGFKMLRRAL